LISPSWYFMSFVVKLVGLGCGGFSPLCLCDEERAFARVVFFPVESNLPVRGLY
jgi:hypothetical protein